MLGRIKAFYEKDMQREKDKQNFLSVYGEPIAGYDLRKSIVMLYPTYFTVVRIIFVVVTLALWHRPGT